MKVLACGINHSIFFLSISRSPSGPGTAGMEEEEDSSNAPPLLEKIYFEGCPGCRIAKKVASNPGIPYKEFFYVWIVTLCTSLAISSLFPFLYFMIRDLHIAKSEEDIGFYAGFVGASYMLGRALTSVFWGVVADRYGRKPVFVIGVISLIIFNALFGLSTSFWMAIITRFLLGALNGLLGPIKAYSVEVSRPEHHAIGVSLVSTSWAVGLVIGPSIGGFFAQPAVNYPNIFSEDSIFGEFPYFLPCLIISTFAMGVAIACIWLPETLHMHNKNNLKCATVEAMESSAFVSGATEEALKIEQPDSASEDSLLKNWPLMSSIIIYCFFSFYDMAYTEVFPLWCESDRKYGGLSFSAQQVGVILAISGFGLVVFQLLIYPLLAKHFGPIVLARIGAVLTIPLLVSFPFISKLSGFELSLILNTASLIKNILCPQRRRGAASGLAVALQSVCKAIGPACAGALFSWAQRRTNASFLPGDHMVFFFLNLVVLAGFLMCFKPFLVLPRKNYAAAEF